MKIFLSRFWPILFIVAVWLIFAHPYFIFGKAPFPADYLINVFAPWSAYPEFAGPVKNSAMPDVITQIYPWKNLVIEIWKSGTIPLWNPYSFSGTPLLANYQSAVFAPINLIYFVLPFVHAWSIHILVQPLLAGLFTYMFMRALKVGEIGAVISSIAFMFSGFIATWMAYGTLPFAILFLPLALFAIEKYFQTKKWFYPLLLSITIPLSFFSGHFQTSLYFLLFIVAYCFFKFIQTRDLKSSIYCLVSIIFGLLISAPQLLPSIELYLVSIRSEIFSISEIIPWNYLPTFLAPDFYGNPVTRNDWFGHYAEWNAYIGLVPLMLGFYSLTINKFRKTIFFFFSIAVISVLLSFQTPLLSLLVNLKIPVLSTSAVSRIIVLWSFSLAVLAGFGFEKIIADIKKQNYKPIIVWLLAFGIIFVVLWGIVIGKIFIPQDKIAISFSNLRLPTLIFGSTLVIFAILLFFKNKKLMPPLSFLLVLIIAFDLLRFSMKWQPYYPIEFVYPNVPVSRFLSEVPDSDRIFGNFGAEAAVIHRAASIEGYDPLYIQRYGEFIRAANDGKFKSAERSIAALAKGAKYKDKVIDFLGVKYLVHKTSDNNVVWTYPIWEYPVDQFKIVYEDDFYQVFENQKVYQRAIIVGDYEVVRDDKKLPALIFDDNLDLKQKALLEENPGSDFDQEVRGEAVIKSYKPNEVIIEASSRGRALLVLSDPYYQGWKAFIDGSETKIFRANYAFRAIMIPEGTSVIKFEYKPDSFRIGVVLGLLGIVALTLALRFRSGQVLSRRGRGKKR